MEKGKGKPPAGDNYDNVNMEMSDESDNEMFACKEEYKAFKQHFDTKAKEKTSDFSEYGGGPAVAHGGGLSIEYGSSPAKAFTAASSEYGSGPVQSSTGSSEYGGGSTEYGGGPSAFPAAGPTRGSLHAGSYGQPRGGYHQNAYPRRSPSPPAPTPAKIEREPKLYKDKDGTKRSKSRERNRSKDRRRSRSGDRHRRTRSRSRGSRRSRSRDRSDRRRSRSRDRGDRRDDWRRGGGGGFGMDRDNRGRGGGGAGGVGWDRRGGGGRIDNRWQERNEHRKNVEEQLKKVEEMGVEMPKYYKPGTVNPLSYAEQMQKRKMLWKKPGSTEAAAPQEEAKPVETAKPAVSFNKWEATNFGSDEANEKFRRLMGIRAAPKPEELAGVEAPGKDVEKIMTDLEKNYEQARLQTHKARGVGLGFADGFGHHSATASQNADQGVRLGGGGPPASQAWNMQPGHPPPSVRGGHINFVKKSY